jgi:hypothetical protein
MNTDLKSMMGWIKMKKPIIIILVIILIVLFLLNYTAIMTSIISKFQYRDIVPAMYIGEFEPKEKIADIAIAALHSILAYDPMVPVNERYKAYKYIAINAKLMPNISHKEVQYILTYFKGYNDKAIYASIKDLKRLGLCTPRTKDLRGGILLSIDEIVEITNEKAVLEISYHISGMGAGGYICTLVYKDNQWQVESLDSTYIA